MKPTLTLIVLFLMVGGCESSPKLSLIEETFHISIPKDHKEISSSRDEGGLVGEDFQLILELKFEEKSFSELEEQLINIDSLKQDSVYYKDIDQSTSAELVINEKNRTLFFKYTHI